MSGPTDPGAVGGREGSRAGSGLEEASAVSEAVRGRSLHDLLAIMERLRGVDGCPWDRAQTFSSIAPYTIEEAYEVADAIERDDMPHLKEELGDLLFQVVFHAQLARESGHFDFDAVASAIGAKLVRRHPHVFGAAQPAPTGAGGHRGSDDAAGGALSVSDQSVVWGDIKAAERAAATEAAGALQGVPRALPALMRAFKLSKRAARVGFDFAHAGQTADKVAEELAEVREAALADAQARTTASAETIEEIGDLLFAAANLARKLEVDAESALHAANRKFERRFAAMERLAAERGLPFASLGLAAQESLWQEVKRGE